MKGGRCEACQGDGTIKIEMHFLPDVYVPCEVCKGARYNRDTLDITWKGKSIADVLDMPAEEALAFFANQPSIARQLQTLVDVGLGYVRLGQPAPTLSGGEAQRVKLSTELGKRATGHTIYILDEPTTGLHFEDVRRLLGVLQRLVDNGNTMLVIEHNLDVIKSADWIIDLGPEGGAGGGTIVAEGTPEQVAKVPESYTGRFLAPLLGIDRVAQFVARVGDNEGMRRRLGISEVAVLLFFGVLIGVGLLTVARSCVRRARWGCSSTAVIRGCTGSRGATSSARVTGSRRWATLPRFRIATGASACRSSPGCSRSADPSSWAPR